MFGRIRKLIEKFYPNESFRIVLIKWKIFFLFLLLVLGIGYFYLRTQNQANLELLKKQNEEIQVAVRDYSRSTSQVNYKPSDKNAAIEKLERYKKDLSALN